MKLQSYKIKYFWDSDKQRIDKDGIYDVNVDFIESVSPQFEMDSYNIEIQQRKSWFGKMQDWGVEIFDRTFYLYEYKMSSGQKFYFDIGFDIDTKTFITKDK